MDSKPIIEVRAEEMKNPLYTVVVRRYALGQKRIQLTRSDRLVEADGHGEIVKECCTYNPATMQSAVTLLKGAFNPEDLVESWMHPWNSDGGRVRMDNTPQNGSPEYWKLKDKPVGEQIQEEVSNLASKV